MDDTGKGKRSAQFDPEGGPGAPKTSKPSNLRVVICADGEIEVDEAYATLAEKWFGSNMPLRNTVLLALLHEKQNMNSENSNQVPAQIVAKSEDADVQATIVLKQKQEVIHAFDAEFKGELDESVMHKLLEVAKTHSSHVHCSPFVPFFQSSGWGKSGLFVEWARTSREGRIIYLHVPQAGANGYPNPTALKELANLTENAHETFAVEHKEETQDTSEIVLQRQSEMWSVFLLAVLRAAVAIPREQLWSDYYAKNDRGWQYSPQFQDKIAEGCQKSSKDLLEELKKASADQPVVVVFDEAVRLGGPEVGGLENWRVIPRELAKISDILNKPSRRILPFVCAAVATVSAGVAFHPHTDHDWSYRIRGAKVGRYAAITGLTSSMDKVTMGRPLWGAYPDASARVLFAAEKLLGEKMDKNPLAQDLGAGAKMALILARTAFTLPHRIAGLMVRGHMATVLRASEEGGGQNVSKKGKQSESEQGDGDMVATYVSEPPLALAAAHVTNVKEYSLKAMLEDITTRISPSVHNNGSAGEVGELFVSVLMNHVMDKAKLATSPHDTFFSNIEIELAVFLSMLLSDSTLRDAKVPQELVKGKINFTHFTRSFNPAHVEGAECAATYYYRGAAVIAPPSYESVDIFIPVLKENGCYVWLFVQVKNYDAFSISFSSVSHGIQRFYPSLVGEKGSKLKYDGLFLLLNLRSKPQRSPLTVTGEWVTEMEDSGTRQLSVYCLRVPDRTYLETLKSCEDATEKLLGLHRKGRDFYDSFSRPEKPGCLQALRIDDGRG